MNHYEFMLNKKNKKPLTMQDYVKNTQKPRKFRGGAGGGRRGGATNQRQASIPPVTNVNIYLGGRGIMNDVSQPNIQFPQNLPVNIGNLQPNRLAQQANVREQRVDLQEVLEFQRRQQADIAQLRNDLRNQVVNPDRQQEIIEAINDSTAQTQRVFAGIQNHNNQLDQGLRDLGENNRQNIDNLRGNIFGRFNQLENIAQQGSDLLNRNVRLSQFNAMLNMSTGAGRNSNINRDSVAINEINEMLKDDGLSELEKATLRQQRDFYQGRVDRAMPNVVNRENEARDNADVDSDIEAGAPAPRSAGMLRDSAWERQRQYSETPPLPERLPQTQFSSRSNRGSGFGQRQREYSETPPLPQTQFSSRSNRGSAFGAAAGGPAREFSNIVPQQMFVDSDMVSDRADMAEPDITSAVESDLPIFSDAA
jgi:hypothetical protein